jgi:hypothetical protein
MQRRPLRDDVKMELTDKRIPLRFGSGKFGGSLFGC